MSYEDLLDHFKLTAEVFPNYTTHSSYKLNRARGKYERSVTIWQREGKIGEGAFGQVWREQSYRPDGSIEVRAVKTVEKQRMSASQVDFKKELLALAKFSKDEYREADVFVSFLGWFETDQSIHLAMEFFDYGDLSQHIPTISGEPEVKQITVNILEGLRIMHQEGFAHRDLKPQNIFVVEKPPVSEKWWVKIGDFGISKRVRLEETALRTQTGTPSFQAPEIQGFIDDDNETSEYSNAVDIWSLGCVIYNIAAKRVPFSRPSEINNFCRKPYPLSQGPLSGCLDEIGINFVECLLVPEPHKRMTVESALRHPFINAFSPLHNKPPPVSFETPPNRHRDSESSISAITGISRQPRARSRPRSQGTSHRSTPPLYDSNGPDHTITQATATGIHEQPQQQEQRSLDVQEMQSDLTMLPTNPKELSQDAYFTLEPTVTVTSSSQPERPLSAVMHNTPDAIPDPTSTTAQEVSAFPQPEVMTSITFKSINVIDCSADVYAVAFSPDCTLLASGTSAGLIELWHVPEGRKHIGRFSGHGGAVYAIAFSPNGQYIASGCQDSSVGFWDVTNGANSDQLEGGHSLEVNAVAFSPDSKLIASGSSDMTIQLWDVATKQAKRTLKGNLDRVMTVAFSPDGSHIASGSITRMVQLWDVATGRPVRSISGMGMDEVYAVAFSPDGKLIASSSRDTHIRLWDTKTGQMRQVLEGHATTVNTVAFSPDSKLLISSSRNKLILVWDVRTGQARQTLSGHSAAVQGVAFSLNGKYIASGSEDRTIRIWGEKIKDTTPLIHTTWITENPAAKKLMKNSFIKKLFD